MATVRLASFQTHGKPIDAPVFVVDDLGELAGTSWHVVVRAYDRQLRQIKRQQYAVTTPVDRVLKLGQFTLTQHETQTAPLLLVADVIKNGSLAHRNYYWSQFEAEKDCILKLARATLALQVQGNRVTVANTSDVPAVGVHVLRPGHLETFTASDNYFWLDPGESQTIDVNQADGLTVSAWNAD
jgi:beta-mannosidase